jgi:hypothetical protein
MGLWESTKDFLSGGGGDSSESDEMAEEWIDEVDSEVDESDEMLGDEAEVDTEPAEEEWDSAYRFAEDFLEMRGFASMVDFTNKCMAHKIDQSPMYRDRISNGVDTMNRITAMQEQMAQIGQGNKKETSYSDKAQKLEDANRVIDQAQKLSGEEDAMVNELIGLGHEFADAIANGQMGGNRGGDVNSNVNESNERL